MGCRGTTLNQSGRRAGGMELARMTQSGAQLAAMRRALLAWYKKHKRALPWRRDHDPYRVWVSEIMLQQTRVAAVEEHYRGFLEAFPTLEALARASEQRVLALWSGLGYYRRARMLHGAARRVVDELGGAIPQSAEQLRELPGVGRYTAAAIASIAFDEPVAVVDGNVERVLVRLDGRAHPAAEAWQRAGGLLDPDHPGDWNQAMMELGATVCTPQAPRCPACPLRSWCQAPGMETAKARGERRRVESRYALVERRRRVYLVQRPAGAAKMAGMWELPESGPASGPDDDAEENSVLCRLRHSITDTDYRVRVVRCEYKQLQPRANGNGSWVPREKLLTLPLTGLTRKILRRLGYAPPR
jgi:A/G-specific adenine glycosylase